MNTRTTPPTTTTTTTPITGLHPRKHKAAATVSAATAPEDASKQRRSSQRPHRRCCSWWWRCCGGGGSPRCLHSDVGHAVEAVVGFLLCGLCIGYFILHHHHRHIIVQIMKHPVLHGRAAFHHVVGRRNGGSGGSGSGGGLRGRYGFRHHFYSGPPRSVTVVLPSVVNPTGRVQRLQAIYETWGPGARAIYVVHQTTDFPPAVPHAVWSDEFHSTPHDRYSYPQLLQLPSSIEAETAGVHRLQYVIETVYTSINPDFAFFVNDHTYVIPEHLCQYLEHQHPEEDMYHGHALKDSKTIVFNSGAAGYVLSRATMKQLVAQWHEHNPTCTADQAPQWLQDNPGLVTTQCLKDVLGIVPVDTRAASASVSVAATTALTKTNPTQHKNKKYHRFHAFPLTRTVSGKVDQWYTNKHQDMDTLLAGADASYNTLLSGADCCAAETISFHYVEHREAVALFATREALLTNPHLSDAELKHLMRVEWPADPHELGFYSQALPHETDDPEGWQQLLRTIRNISTRQTQRDC